MIDIYLKDKSLNCESKINECLEYYQSLDFESYIDIYHEYDRIDKINPKIDKDETNIFFHKKKLKKVNTKFMKECLLESLKRLVETRTILESKDIDSELNSDINTYIKGSKYKDNHFYINPDIYENDIPDKLLKKEEFKRHIIPREIGTIKDKCDSDFFELAPHQLFLKNLISPNTNYYGLLIFHGVGVGKSCSGISIAESFRDIYGQEENKIIILASQNIRIGWRKTIFDPSRGDNQCTGSDYYYENEKEDGENIDDKYARKQIKKYYELSGYAAFANSVKKMLKEGCQYITDEKEIFQNQIKLIENKFSNRVLIIDEVHNIRSDEKSKESRDTIHYIEMVIKYSKKLRLILLTANPMYNLSNEIIWILNMLLLNDNRSIISEKDIFDKEGNLINEELLKDKSKGYISYLRGENPVSFPVRLYPTHDLKQIIKKPSGDEIDNRPKLDIFGKSLDEESKLSFLELYGSELQKGPKGHQLNIYKNECLKYREQNKLQIDVENRLLQLSNIVYPGSSDNYDDLYGDNGLTNTMNHDKNVYSYKSDIVEEYGEFFKGDLLINYSAKIASILNIIDNSVGIVFIYSNWIKSGIIPLLLALEQNGYTKYDGKEVLKDSKKIEKISYEGKYQSEYDDSKHFKKANYIIISGSGLTSNNLEEELKIVTSEGKEGDNDGGNEKGQKIKIIIGSSVASEGLDFKNIRSIHILEPWHNINKLEQVIGRGIRNCSHKKLDSQDRNVTIYLHNSVISDGTEGIVSMENIESIDMYLYRYSEYKAKQIGQIENILKANAIDKYFLQNGNTFSKNDIDTIKVKPSYRDSEIFDHDRSDKKFSRVCSFSEICNFMKNDKAKDLVIPSDNKSDTYQIRYSESVIEIYKKRIHNLYLLSVSYTFDELHKNLVANKECYSDILYHAIREMEAEKYTLHNINGNKGYLVRVDKYYLFQPYYNNDNLLPTYYRINSGKINPINYEFTKREKIKNNFLYAKNRFNNDKIIEVYLRLVNFSYSLYEKKDKKIINKEYHELKIFAMLKIGGDNDITIGYRFDRLSIEDKLVLGYSVLLFLKDNEIIEGFDETIMKSCIRSMEKLFIYYDGQKYYYKDSYHDGSEKDICGFFLYDNESKKPLFYNYKDREIELFNKVDEIDIVRMIKDNQKNKSLSFTGSWGFTTYFKRIKYSDPIFTHNGIVLKVIKPTDKLKKSYVYPASSPGIVIQDQGASGEWKPLQTYEYILDEFKDIVQKFTKEDLLFLEKCSTGKRQRNEEGGSKRYLVCLIECCLRLRTQFIQNDLIFVKYY